MIPKNTEGMNLGKATLNPQVWFWLRKLMGNYPFRKTKIEAIQRRKLRVLVTHAYRNPFYKKRFDAAGVDPESVRAPCDLRRLPVLTREEFRSFIDREFEECSEKYTKWHFDSTSGSSGVALRLAHRWPERAYMIAKWLRTMRLNGYRFTDKTLGMISPRHRTAGRDSFLQRFGLCRRYLVSYLDPVEDTVNAYLARKPDFLYGMKTVLVQMCQHILEKGIVIPKPRAYGVAAETIDANSRALLYRVFGEANFFETYGCEETGSLAFQIKGEEGLNFCHDTNILEVLDSDGRPSESGSCCITDLHIREFPLIRYELGDVLETHVDPESGLQRIDRIRGKLNDWLIWKDGTRSDYCACYDILANLCEYIVQFRVIQERMDYVRILAVLAPGSGNGQREDVLRETIVNSMRSEVKEDVAYDVQFVADILRDASGKRRIVVSKVKQDSDG